MIDVSDGLAGDLRHLLAASGVGATLDVERIPVLPAALEVAARLGEPAWSFAARSGEEYELLAAVPADAADAVVAECPVPGHRDRHHRGGAGPPGHRARRRRCALADGFDHFGAP